MGKFYFITCKFKAEIFIFLSHVTKRWHIYDLHIINVCLHELSQFKARGINVEKRAMLRPQRVSDGIYKVLRWTNTRNREMAWSQGHCLALLHLRERMRGKLISHNHLLQLQFFIRAWNAISICKILENFVKYYYDGNEHW